MRLVSTAVTVFGCLALAMSLGGATGCMPGADGGSPGTGGSNAAAGTTGNGGSSAGTTGNAGTTGDAGSSGDAGTTGAAGSISTAGTTGTAGRGGTTGSAGRGGTTGTAGTVGMAGTTGTGGSASCTFTQSSLVSTMIGSVATITWSTTLASPTSAKIDFGLTTSYGMSAPVSPVTSSNKTMLLGMKFAKMYHYRITATSSAGSCQSDDFTVMTGALPTGLQKPMVTTTGSTTALYGGFLVTGQYVTNVGSGSPAYILDADGDYVWVYNTPNDVTGAVMDYAGTHMWINSANVPSGSAHVRRVTMDGVTAEDLSSQFTGLNHQLTVLPDETIAFYAYNSSANCDDVKERAPSGTVKTVVNSKAALKVTDTIGCHLNNIQYSQSDESLVFSDLEHQQVAKVKRSDGSTVWILNGTTKTFTGDTWVGGEHGLHLLALDRLLVFNNNSRAPPGGGAAGTGDGSIVLELKLDLTAKTATKTTVFKGTGNTFQNDIMGDIQRLPNGNTMVAFSTKGVIVEVDASGTVLQQLKTTANFGYIQKRPTLYGPPPR